MGKTTTSVNLAACLGALGKRTLLIDVDPQGNATSGVAIDKRKVRYSSYNLLVEGIKAEQCIIATNYQNLHILPSSLDLAAAELEIADLPHREQRLKSGVLSVKQNYDYIIIDCPPSLGLITTNALTFADSILVPIQCEYYALEGLTQLLSTIRLTQRVFNPNLSIEGVLLTMLDQRTNLGVEVSQEVRKYFKEKVYRTFIPRNIKLSEAPSAGLSIFDYDNRSEGAKAYAQLAKEVIYRNEHE